MEKANLKINEMSKEIEDKTGVKIILNVLKRLPENHTITTYGKEFVEANLKNSFVVINFSEMDMKINLVASPDLESVVNEDDILDDYIIPLLISQNKKTTPQQKYSAGLLNGMAEVADRVALHKKIVLESSIGSESKNFIDGLTLIIRIMIIITLLALGYAWYRRKK